MSKRSFVQRQYVWDRKSFSQKNSKKVEKNCKKMLMVIYPSWPHRLTAFLITKKSFSFKGRRKKKVLEENKTYDCSKETLFLL